MTHPYRERPPQPAARAAAPRLDLSSVMFGLACGIVGQALAGARCAIVATLVGVMVLIAGRPSDDP